MAISPLPSVILALCLPVVPVMAGDASAPVPAATADKPAEAPAWVNDPCQGGVFGAVGKAAPMMGGGIGLGAGRGDIASQKATTSAHLALAKSAESKLQKALGSWREVNRASLDPAKVTAAMKEDDAPAADLKAKAKEASGSISTSAMKDALTGVKTRETWKDPKTGETLVWVGMDDTGALTKNLKTNARNEVAKRGLIKTGVDNETVLKALDAAIDTEFAAKKDAPAK